MSANKFKQKLTLQNFAYCLLILGFLLAAWYLLFGNYLNGNFSAPDAEKAKNIQPFVTAIVAPIFSLASAILVIVNLRYQTRQSFITNFFNLLNQHHKVLDNIICDIYGLSTRKKPSKKKDFFDDLAQRIAYDYEHLTSSTTVTEEEFLETYDTADKELVANVQIDAKNLNGKDKLTKIYDHYFHIYHSDLSHYFRNLFHLVSFIDNQPFSEDIKKQYTGILRAQLSNYELVILAYNGLHDYGKDFWPLIEKYRLIKSINNEQRVHLNYLKRVIDFTVLQKEYPNNFPL